MTNRWTPLLKFGLVGVLNTAVDFLVFAGLSAAGVGVLPAQWISYGSGVANSYIWNRKWTFREQVSGSVSEFVKFILLNLMTLVIVSLLLWGMIHGMGFSLYLAKILATLLSVIINYIGSRTFIFRA
ncbi:hypothetical protein SY83_04710 [Paenibacillus swuensis]|uniref:GtrA/DPMS transmembrane domain-containing protein n=1 Tax=Paenibacillus swuensis TaxID=1178515 RepID=A0A172TF73_9BACL|nr:GtrA family protein [Paenibacillus swuensis]ANE45715.1 hypothetical protein SY83_04710 [Paenibacillus swuensis]